MTKHNDDHKPLLKRTQDKELHEFTPYQTPERVAVLQDALARAGRSRPYADGVAFGLALTLNAAPEALVPLLDLEGEGPDVQEAAREYGRAVWARVDLESGEEPDLSVDPALFPEVQDVRAWLTGLVAALRVQPEKLLLMQGDVFFQVVGPESVSLLMVLMSFMEDERFGQVAEVQELVQDREKFMAGFAAVSSLDRSLLLQYVLMDVDRAYAFLNMADQLKLGPGLRRAASETVRREGRKVRPNELCPCGSGKKFKKCHGAPGAPTLPE